MELYFAIVGSLALVLAGWLFVRRLRVQLYGVLATGTVVGHRTSEIDGALLHYPNITFVDTTGKEHKFSSVAGSSAKNPKPMVGMEVTVRYLPCNPELVYMTGFLHMWAAPIGLFVMGAPCVYMWWYP